MFISHLMWSSGLVLWTSTSQTGQWYDAWRYFTIQLRQTRNNEHIIYLKSWKSNISHKRGTWKNPSPKEVSNLRSSNSAMEFLTNWETVQLVGWQGHRLSSKIYYFPKQTAETCLWKKIFFSPLSSVWWVLDNDYTIENKNSLFVIQISLHE